MNLKLSFEEKFENILPQAVKNFQTNITKRYRNNPDEYKGHNPKRWTKLKSPTAKFEFIMNDDYWVREWSIFLYKQIIDLIYNDENDADEITFSKN
jgi:hypothetical protein